nr:hypothetical protein [Streptomyces noursei]
MASEPSVLRGTTCGEATLQQLLSGRNVGHAVREDLVRGTATGLADLFALDKVEAHQLRDHRDDRLLPDTSPSHHPVKSWLRQPCLVVGRVGDLHENELLCLIDHLIRQIGRDNHQVNAHQYPGTSLVRAVPQRGRGQKGRAPAAA